MGTRTGPLDLRSERGSNMIEMALVFPMLAIATVAVMDFSLAMWSQHALAHAAREGARYATIGQATDAQIIDVVQAAAVGLDVADDDVKIQWDPDHQPGSTVSIVVSYPFDPLTPFVARKSQTMEGRAAMVVLR